MSNSFSLLPPAWPYARTYHAIILIAVLYGIFSGAFISLLAVPLLSLGKPSEVGERSGLLFTIIAFGAMCGPPISGAIRKETDGWEIVGAYAGKCKEVTE
jgi:MCP family monocarboxylic acid transporter-like MFS transporter 10